MVLRPITAYFSMLHSLSSYIYQIDRLSDSNCFPCLSVILQVEGTTDYAIWGELPVAGFLLDLMVKSRQAQCRHSEITKKPRVAAHYGCNSLYNVFIGLRRLQMILYREQLTMSEVLWNHGREQLRENCQQRISPEHIFSILSIILAPHRQGISQSK